MKSPVSQLLISHAKKPLLARVLTYFDIPFFKYPNMGVWSYLLNTPQGVVVFDTGPYYNTVFGIVKNKTPNTKIILKGLKKYFPQKTISQILISHYHFDHSENAPHLQQETKRIFGNTPPIRLHQKDLEDKKYLKLFKNNFKKIYQRAGYKNWTMGKTLKEGEKIKGSSFSVLLTPGHTTGSVALISHKYQTVIGGWVLRPIKNPFIRNFQNLVNEDPKDFLETHSKIPSGYKVFFYHPEIPPKYPFSSLF